MNQPKKLSDAEEVASFISALQPDLRENIDYLRTIILSTSSDIGERIKWNNPSFYYTGPMASFEPKEYKREIIVLNLFKGRMMLVFPSGAKIKDTSGLLQGDYKDGRRIVLFKNKTDIILSKNALQNAITIWLSLVEKSDYFC